MLILVREEKGRLNMNYTSDHVPREGEYLVLPGRGQGKVKTVQWVLYADSQSVEITLKDWRPRP